MGEVERIAKRMTPGPRRAIVAISGEFSTPPRGCAQWLSGQSKRLVEWTYEGGGQRLYRLTALGCEVRDYLLRNPDA